jgi:hypothetical protein
VRGPRAPTPDRLGFAPCAVCVGDGSVRYRHVLEERGYEVPPDDDERHRVAARFHARLARDFGPVQALVPLYVRAPDADRVLS